MSVKSTVLLVLGSVIFGVLRFILPVGGLNSADVFKDMAHVWIGLLLGVAICKGRCWWYLFWGLTCLEVVAALVRHP